MAAQKPTVCIVGDDSQLAEVLSERLRAWNSNHQIATVGADQIGNAGVPERPTAIVILPQEQQTNAAGSDTAGDPQANSSDRSNQSQISTCIQTVSGAGVDCPIIVVGDSTDTAKAYEDGASDVIPLAPGTHRSVIADQINAIVKRYWERQFSSDLINETNDGVVVHDAETGEILTCNERFYEMLGYDPATDKIGLEDIAGHDEEFTKARALTLIREAAAGDPVTFEWKDVTRDGRTLWVEVKLEAADLAGNEYVIASVRDISTRKERESDLRESRETLEALNEITANPALSFEEQVTELLEFGTQKLGVDIGFLAQIDENDGRFEIVDARGEHELIRPGNESSLQETYCRRTIDDSNDSPYAIADTKQSEMADDVAFEKFDLGCYLGTELTVNGDLYGTLCFADRSPRTEPFSETEQLLIDHMAQWLRKELEQQEYIEELQKTQAERERIVERIDDAFFALDKDWRIRYVNEAGADVLSRAMGSEFDTSELLGRHLWEEIPEAKESRFYDQYHRAMQKQESVIFEERYEPLDTWFEVRAYPDEDGLSVYLSDITDRKEYERELERYGTILESLDDAVYAIDSDGTIQYVNEKYATMKGVDKSDLIGTSIYDWVDDDTARRAKEKRDQVEAADRDVGVVEYEFESVDGERTPAEMRFAFIRDDGESVGRVGVIRDISDRKRNQEIRKQLLSTTRELMDADSSAEIANIVSDAAVTILDHDLNAVYLQDEDSTLSAVAWSDTVDDIFEGVLPPSEGGPVQQSFQRGEPVVKNNIGEEATDGDRYGPVESMLVMPLGEHGVLAVGGREAETFGQRERNRARLLTVNAASALDRMTRRKELEQYETLFETVQDKLYVIDSDGYVEMVSQPLADAIGYEPESLEGQHVSSFLTEKTVREGERRILDLLVTPESVSNAYEGALIGQNGEEIPVEIELSILPHEDQFRGTVGAVRDISERRQREQELDVFRQAVTEAGIGLAMYGADGQFEYVNEHYAQLLGYTRDELLETPVVEVIETIESDSFDMYWQSFTTDETRTTETDLRRPDGTTIPVEMVTSAVEINGTRHHIVTSQEITGRRERRQQSEVLHRIMRHNLRNNVTVILGHAESVVDQLEGPAADSVDTIIEVTERIMQLAETARDAENLITRDTVRQPVEITAMLREIVTDLREEYGVTIETELPASKEVLADSTLRLALRHAITNAVEHNDSATPRVDITLGTHPNRSGWVRVDIADNGPGIPEHERVVLTQGEETQLQHGSGLGLWIIHWVITRFGGTLSFVERGGGGSMVRISLPSAGSTGTQEVPETSAESDSAFD